MTMVDLTDNDSHDLPRDPPAWEKVFADPLRSRDVPSIELLDEDVLLVPGAQTPAAPSDVASDYAEACSRFAEAVDRLGEAPPVFQQTEQSIAAHTVSVTDLARLGAVTFIEPGAARPGDVLVPSASGDFDARVLASGEEVGAKAGPVLRCDPQVLDPQFLACFLRSDVNRRQASGTLGGTYRLDVRRARVPRMPVAEQRRYGEMFRRLTAFTQQATDVAAAATSAARIAIHGLTNGVFAPSKSEAHRTTKERRKE
jgi:hypothetical protein